MIIAKYFRIRSVSLCVFLMSTLGLTNAQNTNDANTKYVQGSRLAFRVAPGVAAAVLDYLPTNSPVRVLRELDSWCEVLPTGREQIGFVSCNFIANVPVTIEVVQRELGQKDLPVSRTLELLQKQFWIKPSVTHLMAYGNLLTTSTLSQERRQKEVVQETFVRPPRPEFEAMKRNLRNGWEAYPSTSFRFEGLESNARLKSFFPVISTSLFNNRDVHLLLGPYIGNYQGNRNQVFMAEKTHAGDFSEILSAAVPGKSKVLKFGTPAMGGYIEAYALSWDIYGAKVELPSGGVPYIGLVSDGKIIQGTIKSWSSIGVMPDAECDQIGNMLYLSSSVTAPVAKAGVLALVLNPAQFNISSAERIFFKTYKVTDSPDLWKKFRGALSGWTSDTIGFVSAFDLDTDNIADVLFVGEVLGSNNLSAGPALQRAFDAYVNVSGEWVRYGQFSAKECSS